MGIPLLAGRDFDSRDERYDSPQHPNPQGPPPYRVAIISESWVRHYVGNRVPIGIPEQVFVPLLESDFPGGSVIHVRTAAALGASRLIGSQLYGIAANDPATIEAAAAVLAAAALAAGYLPARRATRVNPVLALRYA
jgi:hypothetical protein